MKDFCGTEFWNSTLIWDSPSPDFTPCFEKTVLLGVPCIYLLVFVPVEILRMLRSKDQRIPWSWLNISKTIISGVMIAAEVATLVSNIIASTDDDDIYSVDFFYPCLLIVSLALETAMVLLNKRKGLQTSGYLFGFWLLMVIFYMPVFRSSILFVQENETTNANRMTESVLFMILYPLVILMFLLNCFADEPPSVQFYPRGEKSAPLLDASFLNQITYNWLTSLIWKGFRTPIKQEDLYDLPPENTSAVLVKKWDKNFEECYIKYEREHKKNHQSEKKFSIFPVIIKTFWKQLLIGMALKLIPDMLMFLSPQILSLLIAFADDTTIAQWKGYLYAVVLFGVTELQSILNGQQFFIMTEIGLKIRTVATATLYRKALRVSSSSKKETTVGEVVNLMAVDVQRFLDMMGFVNNIWSAPLQIILCIYFLWRVIGPSSMVGLLIMIILVPFNGFIAGRQKRYQISQMKEKDKRIKIVNEILNGIKVLKLYAWEESFIKQITAIRKREVTVLKKISYLGAVTSFVFTCTPFLVSFFMFMTYVLISPDNVLTPDIVFVSISLLNILRAPLVMLPMVIVSTVQAAVAMKRVNKFLNSEELDPHAVERNEKESDPIVIDHGSFTWGDKDEKPFLKNINLRIKEGSLVAIVGAVGAGKSSLCSSILGEMEKVSGRVNVNKPLAYVSQQAWIQNATLKDNILFNKKFHRNFYEKIIKACALKSDLEMLPDGDQTEIGEKGINLSGGQKQRLNLARAVYSDAEIFLMDDPLSAVDSHVGKHLFEQVIGSQGILKNKTRVLVTHGIGYLHKMDEIIVLKEGKIVERGHFSYLINKKGEFQTFLLQYLTDGQTEDEDLDPEELQEIKEQLEQSMVGETFKRQLSTISKGSDGKRGSFDNKVRRRSSTVSKTSLTIAKPDSNKGKLTTEEKAETGRTSLAVYTHYAKAIGYFATISAVALYAASQFFAVFGNILLSKWSENENGAEPDVRNKYLGVYAVFGLCQAFSILVGYGILARYTILASRNLHNEMLARVLRSPMSFFDKTPTGRIVNRFSKDVDIMDVLLPMNIRTFLICLSAVVATFATIIYATPLFVIVMIPATVAYILIQNVYIRSARQLKRIESVTRSPIYTHFSESIQGAVTIRAYNKQEEFILDSEKKVDFNQLSYFPNIVSYRWLSVRLELIGNILTFFAALFTVINRENDSGGDVGLSVSYALSVTSTLTFLLRLTSDVETNVVSVERVKEFTEVPQEAAWDKPQNKPSESWPDDGMVEFKSYSTRYRDDLDFVVKNVNCKINPTEKIGIVGRTGAGKSSLTLALFRIIEPAEGTIAIDGIDISKIGLHDLRRKLTIIPQDPVLFSGSLRMNLDPFDKHSDDSVWNALEHSHLKEFVSTLPDKLNHQIVEGGENLSVGQRQLVCLARALLRKTKVLILDEATAAVDLETDDLIQETIRKEFADSTIITIAHRLNTIMDSTRVIVLDKGAIKEFDSPSRLLENSSSSFYDMTKDAGLTRYIDNPIVKK